MNTIDAILYINLDNRVDRKESILNEIQKIGFDSSIVHRIPAVYNDKCGHLGCGLSHISALDLAIKNNWKRAIVFEDDFHFAVGSEELDGFIQEADNLPHWDVLLLAKGHLSVTEQIGHLQKTDGCSTTSGYIVQNHYYTVLQKNFKESVKIMEEQLKHYIRSCTDPFETIGREFETIRIPEKFKSESSEEVLIRYGDPHMGWVEKKVHKNETFEAFNTFFGHDPSPGRLKYVQIYCPHDIPENIPKFVHGVCAIDQHWSILQRRDHFYLTDPIVGYQGGYGSDTS